MGSSERGARDEAQCDRNGRCIGQHGAAHNGDASASFSSEYCHDGAGLVVPVVIGVVFGGFSAGALSVIAGFLVYDFFFIPPYLTLWVGAPQTGWLWACTRS